MFSALLPSFLFFFMNDEDEGNDEDDGIDDDVAMPLLEATGNKA